MITNRVWVLERHAETRAMWAEILLFDGYEVLSFESSDDLLAHGEETPRATIVDAWTARSSESALVERISCDQLIVTSTTPGLAESWRRLGAARVYLKPVSIDAVRSDVHDLGERAAPPASSTLPRHAEGEEEALQRHLRDARRAGR